MGRLGTLLALVWVGGAFAGWLPGAWIVLAQFWWWLLLSLLVLAVAWTQPVRYSLTEPGWAGLGLVMVTACWLWWMPDATIWLAQILVMGFAGVVLYERFGWPVLRQAVVWWAWGQLALMGWQRWHHADSLTGTVGKRAVLAAVLAFASLWSHGWQARVLALGALATGSFSGLPVLLRLLPLNRKAPVAWIAGVSGVILTARWWSVRLWIRMEDWHIGWWRQHWLTGWGLQRLPSGFSERLQVGERMVTSPVMDLHSTWLDTLARAGVLGIVLLGLVMVWAGWRSGKTKTLWTFVLACWVMTWQSVASQPALLCLGIVWLLSLCQPRSLHVGAV